MNTSRLFFLDWLRILAFGLLVPYHVGMYYVSWDWHVKSPQAGHTIEPLMFLSAPWRLSLLFFIGGVACQALLKRDGSRGFVKRRSAQLLWPLLFGMLVVVPPQAYFEVVTKVAYAGSYLDFMRLYVAGYGGFCRGGDCLLLPTWNHLWFLPYLWLYSLLGHACVRSAPQALADAVQWLDRRSPAQWLFAFALPFAAARLLIAWFPSKHNLTWDWANHAQYLLVFVVGLLLGRSAVAWQRLQQLRWPALVLALLSTSALIAYFQQADGWVPPDALRWLQRGLWGALQWWAIVAACGFARQHLDVDHPWRRALVPAVFCVYILHQTVIVLLTQWLRPWQLWAPAEGLLLIAMTFLICAAVYLLVRRVPLLNQALGVNPASNSTAKRPLFAL